MIKIKKGDSILTVTRGAYTNYYKSMGYRVLRASQLADIPEQELTHPEPDSAHLGDPSQLNITPSDDSDEPDEEEELDLSEIPLGEMTGTQLKQYAEQLGLEIEGLRKRELRELIRNHLK